MRSRDDSVMFERQAVCNRSLRLAVRCRAHRASLRTRQRCDLARAAQQRLIVKMVKL